MKIWKRILVILNNLEKDILVILNNEFKEDPITSTEIDTSHGMTKPVIIRFTGRKYRDDVLERGRDLNKYDLTKFGIGQHQKIYIMKIFHGI